MVDNKQKNRKYIDEMLKEIEKRLSILKRASNNLEIKNQYILQTLENSFNLMKEINEAINKHKINSNEQVSESDNIDIIIETISKKIDETQIEDNINLKNQLKKIKAIYEILKE
ncbi:hypothetical protein [Caldisalinibacter kiritimatiensis]|uniref:Uncharacterized protein n=1 Tax=Caldisalinibacter kiritimatiensis TaxID=1304284 RepID=R1AQX6_9FIRM|nr:hypothetical protein [Caldisalinibacter kiritimatiensis]EOC99527.1 hypothetical protein L21TH_2439 [Caldisalinibacter kiritimatiensis]